MQITYTVERVILINYIGIPLVLSVGVILLVTFYPVDK